MCYIVCWFFSLYSFAVGAFSKNVIITSFVRQHVRLFTASKLDSQAKNETTECRQQRATVRANIELRKHTKMPKFQQSTHALLSTYYEYRITKQSPSVRICLICVLFWVLYVIQSFTSYGSPENECRVPMGHSAGW